MTAMQSVFAEQQRLVEEGRWREAIDLLSDYNRRQPSAEIEKRLVELRLAGFEQMQWETPGQFPPRWHDEFDPAQFEGGIPVIAASSLDLNSLACGVLKYGSLIVRGLLDPGLAENLVADIDRVMSAQHAVEEGTAEEADTAPWFFRPGSLVGREYMVGRKFVAETGSIWAVDSPRMVFRLLEIFAGLGLRELLEDYFGEAPCVSVRKWVLRRVGALAEEPDWHQDGSFLGTGLHSVNLWVALNECGGDTDNPGMDLLPRRFEEIVGLDGGDVYFDWTAEADSIAATYADTPPVRPHFQAGDAVFFDHFNLHRTASSPRIRGRRYAVECWFFAPSTYPVQQGPLVF